MYRLHPSPLALLLSLSVLGTSCSSGVRTDDTGVVPAKHSVLTRSELRAAKVTTALDAVGVLRPRWLRASRGPWAPTVVVDNIPQGDVESLRFIGVEEIKELRYVTARDATTRWGINHSGGVIEVVLGDFIR